jgi:hypothetical protein
VLQSGLDLSRGNHGRLDLEISGAGGSIEGSVIDEQDRPIAGAGVALILEGVGSPPSRSKFTVTDEEGRFRMRGIAPGDYRVYGSPEPDVLTLQGSLYAPEIEAQRKRVSVRQHGHETVVVKVRRGY